MADGKRVTASDLELSDSADVIPPSTLREARENLEREMVDQALKKHSGRISSAAAELGVSRPTLYELMDKLGIGKREANARNSAEAEKEEAPEPQKT